MIYPPCEYPETMDSHATLFGHHLMYPLWSGKHPKGNRSSKTDQLPVFGEGIVPNWMYSLTSVQARDKILTCLRILCLVSVRHRAQRFGVLLFPPTVFAPDRFSWINRKSKKGRANEASPTSENIRTKQGRIPPKIDSLKSACLVPYVRWQLQG